MLFRSSQNRPSKSLLQTSLGLASNGANTPHALSFARPPLLSPASDRPSPGLLVSCSTLDRPPAMLDPAPGDQATRKRTPGASSASYCTASSGRLDWPSSQLEPARINFDLAQTRMVSSLQTFVHRRRYFQSMVVPI